MYTFILKQFVGMLVKYHNFIITQHLVLFPLIQINLRWRHAIIWSIYIDTIYLILGCSKLCYDKNNRKGTNVKISRQKVLNIKITSFDIQKTKDIYGKKYS